MNVRENLERSVRVTTKIPENTHSLFEVCDFLIRQSICLSDDRDEVDLGVQSTHDFDVQRLESVAGGLDEVNACMNTVIHDVHPVDLVLRIEVSVEARFNVLNNRPPRVIVVDKIAEPWRVHNGES